jgi:hypothetical protein
MKRYLEFKMLDVRFGKHIEKVVGLSLNKIRSLSPNEIKKYIEKRSGKKIKEKYCVEKDLITCEELNKEIDKMLGIKEGFKDEEKNIIKVIKAAREVQEFLWRDMNDEAGLEEFKRMFRKRVSKLEKINMSNPHWKIELKKRLLQVAAISVNLITKIDNNELKHEGIHPCMVSNLPQFSKPILEKE